MVACSPGAAGPMLLPGARKVGSPCSQGPGGRGGDACVHAPQRNTLQQLRAEWVEALCLGLRNLKASEVCAARTGRPSVFPFLCVLPEKELAELLLQVRPADRGAGVHGQAGG